MELDGLSKIRLKYDPRRPMILKLNPASEIYFPSSQSTALGLGSTTHLGIGAHQDDLELIAIHGILAALDHPEKFFTGVVVTDGRGSPRIGRYKDLGDDELWQIRCEEQKEAAQIGKYHAQFMLNHPSESIKSSARKPIIDEIKQIIKTTTPEIIYTHNLFDSHDTHVAVSLSVIQALREIENPPNFKILFGCEAWRGLDWLVETDKIPLDVSKHIELQEKLLSVFKSQIEGGKNYDLAALGRRQANATFFQSHQKDQASLLGFAMDMTPLIHKPQMDISDFAGLYLDHLIEDVYRRLMRLRKGSG